MKKLLLVAAMLVLGVVCVTHPGSAQNKSSTAKYEYAIVKWDGPDRLYYNLPNDEFKLVYLEKDGVKIPKDADAEQYCLSIAANRMAKDGWEAVNLDSRRILFRRQLMDANGARIKY